MAENWMSQQLKVQARSPNGYALGLLLATPWPLVNVLELLSHAGRVPLHVAGVLEDYLELKGTQNSLLARALEAPTATGPTAYPRTYWFRVNPHREIVSDMVRFTKLPFCGLRPFMRMITDLAEKAIEAGCPTGQNAAPGTKPCEFTFVEGGPHLGDCAMWAAATLRLAGVQLKAMAFEPLPDASALFQQSVVENGLAGSVVVRPAALGEDEGTTELVYYRGHNGQATVNGDDFKYHRDEVNIVHAPRAALDNEVPASWPIIDALKLSVNGAERDTMAGARKLLSKRRICSVLLHASKCLRGRKPASEDPAPGNPNLSRFAYEMHKYLEEGNMEVYRHNDGDIGPERGGVARLHTASDLDAVFDHPELTEQVYVLARSREAHCTTARRHFHAAAGRPSDATLEDRGKGHDFVGK
eukprot:TRINITY_DN658_c0_g3_i2.p1 TRINITY_DN658_c0_g3~~TRINITY_DN658_c0_g3_i2.p1  ORF type:complete len:438 (+),score=80.06 TRINITY_DN658_c0_g3_i2:75-1316(+)